MPHATTYARLLARLNVEELEYLVGRFLAQDISVQEGKEIVVALDGKVLRGTIPPEETQGVVLLAAYVPEHGVAVMQVEVEGGGDEAVAAPRVLSVLNLQGVVVTGDAMYTERTLCEEIVWRDQPLPRTLFARPSSRISPLPLAHRKSSPLCARCLSA